MPPSRCRLIKGMPVMSAQLLLLTGIITGLYYAWIHIMESAHHPAVKTLLVVLLSCGWGVLVEVCAQPDCHS